jgi:hypothetical protein
VDTRKDNVVVLLSLIVREHTVNARWWGQVNGQVESHEWEEFNPQTFDKIEKFLLKKLANTRSESKAVE